MNKTNTNDDRVYERRGESRQILYVVNSIITMINLNNDCSTF
jgi:hypothetical protein